MNLLYHALVGATISKALTGSIHNEALLVAVLPDLYGTLPNFYSSIRMSVREAGKAPRTSYARFFLNRVWHAGLHGRFNTIMYRGSHTFLALLPFGLLFYLLSNDLWVLLSLSYLSHTLVDIPTHSGNWATRIFYPLSDFHLEGSDWWTNKSSFFTMWLLLVAVLVLVFFSPLLK